MTRAVFFAAGLSAALSVATAAAQLPVAPPPREIKPDGSRAPAPQPEPKVSVPKSVDPVETVNKIIENSGKITERLGKRDTGDETRKTQAETLALIDSLLDQKNPDKNPDQNKDKKDQNGGTGDMQPKDPMMQPKGGMQPKDMKDPNPGMPPPKNGMEPGGMPMAKGGTEPKAEPMGSEPDERDPQRDGRRPRMGSKTPDKKPNDGGEKKQPGGTAGGGMEPKDKKNAGGQEPKENAKAGGPTGGAPKGTAAMRPSIPLEDEIIKQVWGSHRELLRMQVPQYYNEQFMPRYKELLRLYYSSLADATKSPGSPGK